MYLCKEWAAYGYVTYVIVIRKCLNELLILDSGLSKSLVDKLYIVRISKTL